MKKKHFFKNSISFDKSAAEFILDTFGYNITQENLIVDSEGIQVRSHSGIPLTLDNFVGIAKDKKGNRILLDDNICSLMDFVDKRGQD